MTRRWYAAKELAGLPGLPGSERGVQLRADREGWRYREVPVRGGRRREYHVGALPEATRVALATRELDGAAPVGDDEATLAGVAAARELVAERERAAAERRARKERAMASWERLPERARAVAEARYACLRVLDAFLAGAGYAPRSKRGTQVFCRGVCSGEIRLPEDAAAAVPRRRGVRSLSYATVARWRERLALDGLPGLAPGYRAPNAGVTSVPEPMRRFIRGMMLSHPGVKAVRVMQGLQARFDGQPIPTYSAVRRYMAGWARENAGYLLYVTNPDAYRSRMQAAMGLASESVTRPNQVWEMDATPADVMLADGKRHAIVGVIDVCTRRLRLLVTRTSTGAAVAGLVRRAMLDWGVPETIRRDNGRDFCSRHVDRVLTGLEIETVACPPFTPEGKPHIERAFRTMAHGLVELLPGYVGHDVAERQAIEARKSFAERLMTPGESVSVELTAEQIQELLDRWVEAMYHTAPHRGLGGRTPIEAARAWDGPVRRITDERALDLLLLPAADGHGWRTVGKKGLRVEGRQYVAPELGAHVGERVRVLLDETDLGRAYVFGGAGEGFLCVAECPEWTGISRAEVAAHAREKQKELERQWRREKRELLAETDPSRIAWEILEHRERQAANVVELPRPEQDEPYTTPALEEAAQAAEARDGGVGWADDIWAHLEVEAPEPEPQPDAKVVALPEPFFATTIDLYDHYRQLAKRRPLTPKECGRLRQAYRDSVTLRQLMEIEQVTLEDLVGDAEAAEQAP